MITAPAAFITAVQGNGRTFRARIFQGSTEVEGTIRNLTVTKGAFGDEVFTAGALYSSQISIVTDLLSTNLENQDISLQIGVLTAAGSYSYITIGEFTITQARSDTKQTSLTGLGYIATKLTAELPTITNQTLANIASAISSTSGISVAFKDGITTSGVISESLLGLTCREALEVVASVVGGYATENASGGIEIHKFQIPESKFSVTPNRVLMPPQLADDDFVMTGIEVAGPSGTFSRGDPIRQYYLNRYMTQSLFDQFATNLIGYTFRSGEVPVSLGDPRLEPWDCLAVTDLDGDVFNVPCHQITHTFDGGFSSQIWAVGESITQPAVKGPIMQRVEDAEALAEQASEDAAEAVEQATASAQAAQSAQASASQAATASQAAQNSAGQAAASAQAAQNSAGQAASQATASAQAAQAAQNSASQAADQATASAQAAQSAQTSADQAESQAMAAAGSANAALMQLGVVEDVLGTLSWISQHGTYTQTSDTEVVEGKFYFIQNGSEYQVVTNPTGDPNAQGWYELSGVDEAVSSYVASHLSLTDAGLYVQADGIASKLLLSSGGVTIFGPNGNPIAEYGTTAKIGDPNGFHIELNPTELGFYQGQLKVAYVSNNQLYITQSVVLERMDLGTPVSQGGLGQWSWKVHEVDGMNNLYLKWLG